MFQTVFNDYTSRRIHTLPTVCFCLCTVFEPKGVWCVVCVVLCALCLVCVCVWNLTFVSESPHRHGSDDLDPLSRECRDRRELHVRAGRGKRALRTSKRPGARCWREMGKVALVDKVGVVKYQWNSMVWFGVIRFGVNSFLSNLTHIH